MRLCRLNIKVKEDWSTQNQLIVEQDGQIGKMRGRGIYLDPDTRAAIENLMPGVVKAIEEQYGVTVEGFWMHFNFKNGE